MKTTRTHGIVLSRIDYGEADRIITLLTPDHGKITLMARGVRKIKSKLAGGIELFSTSDISFVRGKGDIGTLVSTQLIKHHGNIIKDIERVQLGYELIKLLNKATEDSAEGEYFDLLDQVFKSLDDASINLDLVKVWFYAQLLTLSGHTPNMNTDNSGEKLSVDQKYNFDYDNVSFAKHPAGRFEANHIKTMRLLFSGNKPKQLSAVEGFNQNLDAIKPLVTTLQKTYQHF